MVIKFRKTSPRVTGGTYTTTELPVEVKIEGKRSRIATFIRDWSDKEALGESVWTFETATPKYRAAFKNIKATNLTNLKSAIVRAFELVWQNVPAADPIVGAEPALAAFERDEVIEIRDKAADLDNALEAWMSPAGRALREALDSLADDKADADLRKAAEAYEKAQGRVLA